MMDLRTRIGFWDAAVCLALIFASVMILFFPGDSDGDTVLVKTDGGAFTYPLTENRVCEIQSNCHVLTVEIKDGAVRISDSDCPDGLCEKAGWLGDSSGVIVCAPAKILVKLQDSGGDPNADIIAGR